MFRFPIINKALVDPLHIFNHEWGSTLQTTYPEELWWCISFILQSPLDMFQQTGNSLCKVYQVFLKNMTIEKYYQLKNITLKEKAIEKI